ncbi:MAG: Holliday junction resolvase RecU [Bacilli bacterium]|nr:Holliday junction resolvase RecU [Bacilli bacterium]
MTISYPKGVKPISQGKIIKKSSRQKARIQIAPGNRGMSFESAINETNDYYKEKGFCLITKRPTPINVVKVDYTHGAKITQAFFEKQSTTDYNGVYKGHYIDFEAKSSIARASFPLNNIPPQQISHLEGVLQHGGIAFFLMELVALKEVYLLPAEYVIRFYKEAKRKSIPFADIKENGALVKEGFRPRYDYLPLVEELFLK